MADSADELLSAIAVIYQRWLAGTLSGEDTLFEIGDLLAQATETAKDSASLARSDDRRGSS